jgi:hypothetical protein
MAKKEASAQTVQQAHLETVQYSVPPVPAMTVCEVNGVDYQVDSGIGFGRSMAKEAGL